MLGKLVFIPFFSRPCLSIVIHLIMVSGFLMFSERLISTDYLHFSVNFHFKDC